MYVGVSAAGEDVRFHSDLWQQTVALLLHAVHVTLYKSIGRSMGGETFSRLEVRRRELTHILKLNENACMDLDFNAETDRQTYQQKDA